MVNLLKIYLVVKLLKQLFDVTEKFNMQTQPQLLMLQKTMVVVEGVARKLKSQYKYMGQLQNQWLRKLVKRNKRSN